MNGNDGPLVRQENNPPMDGSNRGSAMPSPVPPGVEGARSQIPADDPRTDESLGQGVRDMAGGLYFYGSSARIFPQLNPSTCISYVAGMVEDSGDPGDPLVRLLVEQLIQLHHAGGRLLMRAEGAATAEARSLLVSAAARMFSEYRKSLLALRTIRQRRPPPPR